MTTADDRAWRHSAILRIAELTGRVPRSVLLAGTQRTVQWRAHATKASRLIEQRAPSAKSLREALTILEQYE